MTDDKFHNIAIKISIGLIVIYIIALIVNTIK